jgi:hypothetical protein
VGRLPSGRLAKEFPEQNFFRQTHFSKSLKKSFLLKIWPFAVFRIGFLKIRRAAIFFTPENFSFLVKNFIS